MSFLQFEISCSKNFIDSDFNLIILLISVQVNNLKNKKVLELS